MLDAPVASTGSTRDHARRAIRLANAARVRLVTSCVGPRPRRYSYDALVVLHDVWRLSGQPCGKYLAAVMDDTVERLTRHRELGKGRRPDHPQVLDELQAIASWCGVT